jgi:hypothetical protein
MQALQMAANVVHLPKSALLRSLDEMLQRLPYNLKDAQEKFATADVVEICDTCLRCCNLLFEIFVANFRMLSGTKEFTQLWLTFVCTLAENLKIANRGLPIFDETVEMIGALLRLPRPSPVAVDVLSSHTSISSAMVSDTPVTFVTDSVSDEIFGEDNLLRESWRRILRISQNISHILSAKHPKIVSDLNSLLKGENFKTSVGPATVSPEDNSGLQLDEKTSPTTKKSNSGVFSVFGF